MPPIWLLDACCLLNLLASGCCEAILRAPHGKQTFIYAVAETVAGEVRYLRRGGEGEDAEQREPVDLEPLFSSGLLRLERLETAEELTAFVTLAVPLDDGEAATCALALQRGYGVATDERRARRLLALEMPAIQCMGTLELLKAWSETADSDNAAVAPALRAVRDRSRYIPPQNAPLRAWWDAAIDS